MDWSLIFPTLWDFVLGLFTIIPEIWSWLQTPVTIWGFSFTPMLPVGIVITTLFIWGLLR